MSRPRSPRFGASQPLFQGGHGRGLESRLDGSGQHQRFPIIRRGLIRLPICVQRAPQGCVHGCRLWRQGLGLPRLRERRRNVLAAQRHARLLDVAERGRQRYLEVPLDFISIAMGK